MSKWLSRHCNASFRNDYWFLYSFIESGHLLPESGVALSRKLAGTAKIGSELSGGAPLISRPSTKLHLLHLRQQGSNRYCNENEGAAKRSYMPEDLDAWLLLCKVSFLMICIRGAFSGNGGFLPPCKLSHGGACISQLCFERPVEK